MKQIRDWTICIVLATASSLVAPVFAQDLTDGQLLQAGKEGWNHRQCVRAARYLFAYELRKPLALQQSPEHAKAVRTAINWCETNTMISAGAAGVDGKFDAAGVANTIAQRPDLDLDPQSATPVINMKNWEMSAAAQVRVSPAALAMAANDKRCDVYARIAVAQQDANVANQCGFTGSRWDSRYDHHYNWCRVVATEPTRAETEARQRLLDSCAP